jgi:hypothetical protein
VSRGAENRPEEDRIEGVALFDSGNQDELEEADPIIPIAHEEPQVVVFEQVDLPEEPDEEVAPFFLRYIIPNVESFELRLPCEIPIAHEEPQ